MNNKTEQTVTDEVRCTAAGGHAEIINVPGYPLMVRAVDYNNLRAQPARKRLTRAQVVDGFANCGLNGVNARLGFNAGVRFAENAHGITQKDAG